MVYLSGEPARYGSTLIFQTYEGDFANRNLVLKAFFIRPCRQHSQCSHETSLARQAELDRR
jgi:hypothetical protein